MNCCPQCNRAFEPGRETCMWCGAVLPMVKAPELQIDCPDCEKPLEKHEGREGWLVYLCGDCGGIWISNSVFAKLEKMFDEAVSGAAKGGASTQPKARDFRQKMKNPDIQQAYRFCPQCGRQMSRRNYKKISGVVIDRCLADGVWFDAGEFEQVLLFLKAGGLEASRQFEGKLASQRSQFSQDLGFLATLGRSGPYYYSY